jgi:cholesterol oxidase
VLPDRTVTDVRPLDGADGASGYEVRHVRSGGILRRSPQRLTAGGVIFAAGALGTNRLLTRCKRAGSLPRISDRLGELVRTNSESIVVISSVDESRDFTDSVTISSSIDVDDATHIELCTFGHGADSMAPMYGLLTPKGGRRTRPFFFVLGLLRRPRDVWRLLRVRGWSQRTVLLLVMQTLPSAIRLKVRARLPGGAIVLTTEQDSEKPNADLVPQAYGRSVVRRACRGSPRLRSQKPSCGSRRPRTSSAALSSARRPRLVSSTSTTAYSATRTCSSATARRCRRTSARTRA